MIGPLLEGGGKGVSRYRLRVYAASQLYEYLDKLAVCMHRFLYFNTLFYCHVARQIVKPLVLDCFQKHVVESKNKAMKQTLENYRS
jgi:hypothetical protein